MADGRWPMADGRWPMADGRFQNAIECASAQLDGGGAGRLAG
jgi:hypothetical protein